MINTYRGLEALVTGGLGFLGSNLSIRLVNLGAKVTIVDALVNGCGANSHNLAPIAGCVRVIHSSIGTTHRFREAIRRADIIFNLAGEISHIHSMRFPKRDALLNASTQLSFLEECARATPGVRIVYAGTRQIYGVPQYLPVDEEHPICPVDFNGIHNYSAIMYHQLYSRLGKLDAVVLNLTNLYGPRMAISIPCQGFLGNFVRKMVTGRRLEVFGDGRQLRDPLFVDDAVDAFLAAGAAVKMPRTMYNVGGPDPIEIGRLAEVASRLAGLPAPMVRPFPPEQKQIDIGSYYSNSSRFQQDFEWAPKVRFEEGIERTLTFYRRERTHYLDSSGEPACRLEAVNSRAAVACK